MLQTLRDASDDNINELAAKIFRVSTDISLKDHDYVLEENKFQSAWVFFADFSKDFDLIDHKILMTELRKLEVDPALISWITA